MKILRLSLGTLAAMFGLALSADAGPKFIHAKVGNLEILSSDSESATRKLLYELIEVREQIRTITGSAVVPDPTMLVVIFDSAKAFEAFIPSNAPKPEAEWRSTSLFWRGDSGLTLSLIKDETFESSREIALMFYANFLLTSLVPNPPLWMKIGLPEYLSTVEYRRGKISLGRPARDHRENLKASRLLPLAKLCDDAQMSKHMDTLNHKSVLYHESWAFWHFLLSSQTPSRLEAVRNIVAEMRSGEVADGATVGRAFGLPLTTLQEQERDYFARWQQPTAQLAPAGESQLRSLVFAPATELDRKFALAVLFGRARKGLGVFALDLLNLARANPESARPYEALANLAVGDDQGGDAEHHWERARENGSTNPFAYLQAVRRHRTALRFNVSLRAEISEMLTERLRGLLDHCLALNPGEMEAYAWLAIVEAYAPTPRGDALDRIDLSQAHALYPAIAPQLAMARWRLGAREDAKRALREAKAPSERTAKYYASIVQKMEAAEQAAAGK